MPLTLLLMVLYPAVIKYKRGHWYNLVGVFAALAYLMDLLANYTEWWWVFGRPGPGQYTVSKRIRAMQEDTGQHEARRKFAAAVQVFLDAFEDDGKH